MTSLAWAQTASIAPKGAGSPAISCPTATLCVTTWASGPVITSTDPTGGAKTWHSVTVKGTTAITAVSCTSDQLCTAVYADGNAITGS